MRTFSFELSAFPNQGGDVIIKIPNLLQPLRGPVVLVENVPRESVKPAGIHGLTLKDVFVLTLEVVLEE
jgi:hypothetical protein